MPVPTLSVIVPFHRGLTSLWQALAAIDCQLAPDSELIVVVDGSDGVVEDRTVPSGPNLTCVVELPEQSGPAAARNAGARTARHDILVFIDADVVIAPGSLEQLARIFADTPSVSAVFGAYDERPADRGFVSQYKNLAHSFVHRSSPGRAQTFWAGFGAVRRDAFLAVGGFDERFRRPSVEDIDLGYRLSRAGFEIRLEPSLQATHLKRWTFASMVVSDVRDRGIPWTQLLLRYGGRHDVLNLRAEHRLGVVLAYLAVLSLALSWIDRRVLFVTAALLVALAITGQPYYSYFHRARGALFTARAFLLHTLQHLYNGLSFVVGALLFVGARQGLRLPGSLPLDPPADSGYKPFTAM